MADTRIEKGLPQTNREDLEFQRNNLKKKPFNATWMFKLPLLTKQILLLTFDDTASLVSWC